MKDPREMHKEREALKELLEQHLCGVDPDVIGGVLGDLLAKFLIGHNPTIRDEVKVAMARMVDDLIDVYKTSSNYPWPKTDVLN